MRFEKSTFRVQKVHFLGVLHPPKIDPGYGPDITNSPRKPPNSPCKLTDGGFFKVFSPKVAPVRKKSILTPALDSFCLIHYIYLMEGMCLGQGYMAQASP